MGDTLETKAVAPERRWTALPAALRAHGASHPLACGARRRLASLAQPRRTQSGRWTAAFERLPSRDRGRRGVPARCEDRPPVPANLEPVLTLLLVAVVANLVVMGVVIIPPMIGRRSPFQPGRTTDAGRADAPPTTPPSSGDLPVETLPEDGPGRHVRPRRPDRQLGLHPRDVDDRRASPGSGRETQPAIFVLLAFAGLFVARRPRPAAAATRSARPSSSSRAASRSRSRRCSCSLTGGEHSPFFFTFPLIVGGAALVVSPRVTFGLAPRSRARLPARDRRRARRRRRSNRSPWRRSAST